MKDLMTILENLHGMVKNGMDELLEKTSEGIDYESIGERLLKAENDSDIGCSLTDAMYHLITIAQYIETDTTMESILSEETYDSLAEKYYDMTGKSVTGTEDTATNKPIGTHKYPELRGSIDKVHFIYDKDIPDKDSRKSMESYYRNTLKDEKLDEVIVGSHYKYDGVSGVFECSYNKIERVLTRKDTESNTGTIITHIFEDYTVEALFDGLIPKELLSEEEYGIQTEIYMRLDDFDRFCDLFISKKPKNFRSAVSKITNTLSQDYNPNWFDYIRPVPVMISVPSQIDLDNTKDGDEWYYAGFENGRHQYVRCSIYEKFDSFDSFLSTRASAIEDWQKKAEVLRIPIDGVVYTIVNTNIIKKLGRKDNKNKFQVAYKIPAGEKISTVKDVIFTVGPVTGMVTPVVVVEPIKIMGNTITHITSSNYDKFQRLNLHKGDDIVVHYNIIPSVYKDERCVKVGTETIHFPEICPECGKGLIKKLNVLTGNHSVNCNNYDCPSRIAGKIQNYVEKMKIMNVGDTTIEDFVKMKYLKSIPDLYRLPSFRNALTELPGYGETKVDKIIKGTFAKMSYLPHEILGAIGIPDIGRRVMKKVCERISFDDLLDERKDSLEEMCHIKGIGYVTAEKICKGIDRNREMLEDLLGYIEVKDYSETPTGYKILFSSVRDKEFAKYLEEYCNVEVVEGYSKSVDYVIVKDYETRNNKIKAALDDNKILLSLEDAKEKFGYGSL